MDIIDIMLARAMTPQGQTDLYVSKANKAAAKAAQAEADAQAAIDVVTNAAEEITAAQEAAADLLATAQDALETAQEAQINTLDTEDVDAEVRKLQVAVNLVNGNSANTYQVVTSYPDNTLHTENATKMYKATGTNEDGTMTQKAITAALDSKADSATTASKEYVDNAIAAIPTSGGSGGNINFNEDDAGHIVVVDEHGNATTGDITEEGIIEAMIKAGAYNARNSVGLEINYANKSFNRTQDAAALSMGADFNSYPMYGGRMRCNVSDNGIITAFYGDNNYTEDGSNGQVMVYQPKFYYQRVPLVIENTVNGAIIRKESLIITATQQAGFKLAPIFKQGDDILEYVFFSAYDGNVENGLMRSVANVKPTTNMTIVEAENYATARGTGWHILNMAAESANQMLEIVEFGSMNGQESLGKGICQITGISDVNCSSLTGSTSSLGNASGSATMTINDINGDTTNETDAGKVAVSYRGIENPWGNVWRMIGGINIYGNGARQGGTPYICTDFNYTPGEINNNYESIEFNLPSVYNWVSAMGYGSEKYDWVFLPIECSSTANSLLPVGDNMWTVDGLDGINICAVGGSYNLQADVGPFYYAVDRSVERGVRHNYGARLMYIPTKGTIYNNNINKWTQKIGG